MIEVKTTFGDTVTLTIVDSSCEKAVTILSKNMIGPARAWLSLADVDELLDKLETARFDLACKIEDAT
jgi:hypothetical protein